MANNNARIIEKNALSSSIPASGGDGDIIDLFGKEGGASKYSCQLIYDVLAFSPAVMASATNVFASTDPDHPSQFEKTNHGFITGLKVQIISAGTLPSGLVALTDYFVIRIDANFFQLATNLANSLAGTPIALATAGIGNQTVTAVALASATVKLQKSNDAINWVDVQAATAITVDGSVFIEVANVSYRYVKPVKAITSGAVDVAAKFLVIGDAQ